MPVINTLVENMIILLWVFWHQRATILHFSFMKLCLDRFSFFMWKVLSLNVVLLLLISPTQGMPRVEPVCVNPWQDWTRNRSDTIAAKLKTCSQGENIPGTNWWKTHWALGHPVHSANWSGLQMSLRENMLPVMLLGQVSEEQESTTRYSGDPVEARKTEMVIKQEIIKTCRRIFRSGMRRNFV